MLIDIVEFDLAFACKSWTVWLSGLVQEVINGLIGLLTPEISSRFRLVLVAKLSKNVFGQKKIIRCKYGKIIKIPGV